MRWAKHNIAKSLLSVVLCSFSHAIVGVSCLFSCLLALLCVFLSRALFMSFSLSLYLFLSHLLYSLLFVFFFLHSFALPLLSLPLFSSQSPCLCLNFFSPKNEVKTSCYQSLFHSFNPSSSLSLALPLAKKPRKIFSICFWNWNRLTNSVLPLNENDIE